MCIIRKIISVIISAIIVVFTILFIFSAKQVFSENENRYLAKFPEFNFSSLRSGEFTEKLSTYLSDHFPFRDMFMGIKTSTFKLLGNTEINGVYLGRDEYLLERYDKPKNQDKIISTINKFAEKNQNANISFMLVPTSVEIYKDKLPSFAINYSEKEVIDYYYNNIIDNVKCINLLNPFTSLKHYIDIYYRLDHHWTTFGAYIAYYEYCVSNNIKPLRNIEYEQISDRFNGTLYSKTNDYTLTPDSIYKIKDLSDDYTVKYVATNKVKNTMYEEKYLEEKDKYSYFLNNNQPIIEITNNDIDSKESLLVIKDSYANAFIPFLIGNYKKIYVIDPRYYTASITEYINKNEIENILILYNIMTIDNDTGISIIAN